MSFEYYCHWWIKNKAELETIKRQDEEFLQSPPVSDRGKANKLVGGMYAKYCMLVKELDLCLDQLAQSQKTITIRKLVESAVTRLRELFSELRWIDFSEYHYIDDSLVELKLIPHDIEVLHPYLSYPRPYDIQQLYERVKLGENIYTKPQIIEKSVGDFNSKEQIPHLTPLPTPVPSAYPVNEIDAPKKERKKRKSRARALRGKKEEIQLTAEEMEIPRQKKIMETAITLIQRHERARQARLYHNENFYVYLRNQQKSEPKPEASMQEKHRAAKILQKAYMWHFWERYKSQREQERRMLIGINEKSYRSRKELEKVEEQIEKRRKLRELRIKQYIEANLAEKVRILRVVGPGLMEDIGDEIREWFRVWYDQVKRFDKIPLEEKGGTILIVRGETLTPEEWKIKVEKKRRAGVKAGGDKEMKAKLKVEKAKKKEEKKKEKKSQTSSIKKSQ